MHHWGRCNSSFCRECKGTQQLSSDSKIDYARKGTRIALEVPKIITCCLDRLRDPRLTSMESVTSMVEAAFLRTHQSIEIILKAACLRIPDYSLKRKNFPKILKDSRCKRFINHRHLRAVNTARNELQHGILSLYSAVKNDPFEMMILTLDCIKAIFNRYNDLGIDSNDIEPAIIDLRQGFTEYMQGIEDRTGMPYSLWKSVVN